MVEIVAYSLLPNHFHLLIKQKVEGGISEFIKRLQGGYTSYFNEEHERSGALFQGKYKYKHVANDEYFKTIVCYVMFNSFVHKIPKDKMGFVTSSFGEYKTRLPILISKIEMDFVFDIFANDIEKLKGHGLEITSIIRDKRSQKEYKEDKNMFE